MAKKGLVYIMSYKDKSNDSIDYKITKQYRFIPDLKKNCVRVIIEAELYEGNVCVISFFQKGKGTEENKYKLRFDLSAGHVKSIFRACLDVYYDLGKDYALIFFATNSSRKNIEYNARYSAYTLFLSRYLKDFMDYDIKASIRLNTYMIYHRSFQYKNDADAFFYNFERKIEEHLRDEESESN